jgi:hypothetical protein
MIPGRPSASSDLAPRLRRAVLWAATVLAALVLGACGPRPRADEQPPLPPCDDARAMREEGPPAPGSERSSLVLLAVQEWVRFGSQEVDFRTVPPVMVRRGAREDGTGDPTAPLRVAAYWRATGFQKRNGSDGIPWSAAFISWLFVNAGVPASTFCPDQLHAIYVERIAVRARSPGAQLVPHLPADYAPQPGDLVCAARENSRLALDNLNRGVGHCDLVVERRADSVLAIGGNVTDSVTRSQFPLDSQGHLVSPPSRPFFAVIENRLP